MIIYSWNLTSVGSDILGRFSFLFAVLEHNACIHMSTARNTKYCIFTYATNNAYCTLLLFDSPDK
jgi:hypothetical protein